MPECPAGIEIPPLAGGHELALPDGGRVEIPVTFRHEATSDMETDANRNQRNAIPGSRSKLSMVEDTKLPSSTTAIGPAISWPAWPLCKATGNRASVVNSAVISTGVNRSRAPRRAVSRCHGCPSSTTS